MTDENPDKAPKVHVFSSTRMADPGVPDDVIHGKRFVDPNTGRPASIEDILGSLGVIAPERKTTET